MDHRRRLALAAPTGALAVRVSSRVQLSAFFTAAPQRRDGGGRTGPAPALTAEVRVVIHRHFPVASPGGGNRIVSKVAEDIVLRRRPSRALRAPASVDRAFAKDVLPLVRHPFHRGAVVSAGKEISAYVAAACANPRIAHGGAHVLVLVDTFTCPVLFLSPPPSNKMMVMQPPGVCASAPKSFACPPPSNEMMMQPPGVCTSAPKSFACPQPSNEMMMQPEDCLSALKIFCSLVKTVDPCMDFESTVPADEVKPVGVIGDRRPLKPVGVIGDKRPEQKSMVAEERFSGWVPW